MENEIKMENAAKKTSFWNKRLGKSDKGTSDYVNHGLVWSIIACEVALALLIGLIVIL